MTFWAQFFSLMSDVTSQHFFFVFLEKTYLNTHECPFSLICVMLLYKIMGTKKSSCQAINNQLKKSNINSEFKRKPITIHHLHFIMKLLYPCHYSIILQMVALEPSPLSAMKVAFGYYSQDSSFYFLFSSILKRQTTQVKG